MIVVKLQGGLGNQMFQYAYGYSLAKRYNMRLELDTHFYENNNLRSYKLDVFSLSFTKQSDFKQIPMLIKTFESRYINKILRMFQVKRIRIPHYIYYLQTSPIYSHDIDGFGSFENLYVSGYWQSPNYFEKYRVELCKEFTLKEGLSHEAIALINEIRGCNSVSIHVRRGDYLLPKNRRYNVNLQYYHEAIRLIEDKYPNITLYAFSDDPAWVERNFSGLADLKIVALPGENSDVEEMICMSQCSHNINANSSFSWWGAWLNNNSEKIVVNPDRHWDRDMIPSSWIIVKNPDEEHPE